MTGSAQTDFEKRLARATEVVNDQLDDLLSSDARPGEIARPKRLMAAMRHGVLNGGKRLRPFLLLESARLCGGSRSKGMLRAACALECLHCYSLIHDDLPAMDDDDLRRGKPTVHRAFDDATAILAGDALLTFAFQILADPKSHPDPAIRAELGLMLARASGMGGMIGGQMLDLAAEHKVLKEAAIRELQAMKTGALIRFACEAGAVVAGAGKKERVALVRYGEIIGLAFQLADDLLDVTSDAARLGKAASKDGQRGKGTLVALYGIEKTGEMLANLMRDAEDVLEPFGKKATTLKHAARFIAERGY